MKTGLKRKLEKMILGVFYISLVTLGCLLLAEVSARILLPKDSAERSLNRLETSEAYSYFDWRDQYFNDRRKPGGRFTYEPFAEWKHTDKNTDLINIRDGYRVTWEPEKVSGKEDFVIFMFGGSTTFCLGSPDELTIASILAKKLNESSLEHRYVIRNYGAGAFVSDQEVHLLIKLLGEGKRPDAVIFYDGLNDIQFRVGLGRTHYYDVFFEERVFSPASGRRVAGEIAYRRSRLVSYLVGPPSMRSLFPFIQDRATLRKNAESMLVGYEENTRVTKALGNEYGFRTVHFWQPSIFNTGKELTPEEAAKYASARTFYDGDQLAHDIVAEVAEEKRFFERTGVIDIGHVLDNVSETVFVDSNHVTPVGNAVIADAMLYWILNERKAYIP